MKNLLLIFSVLLSTSLSAVEYGYFKKGDTPLTLLDGEVIEFLSIQEDNANQLIGYEGGVNFSANWNEVNSYQLFEANLSDLQDGVTFVGPIVLALQMNSHSDSRAYIGYKLMTTSELEYKNVNIISLPSSAVGQGTHEIVVEASDDLQSWTPVHSSSIGGNKAFFRTRVVETE